MNLYICSKDYYEQHIKHSLKDGKNVVFPEVTVPHYNWFDFITNNIPHADNVISQSSEVLKFLRITPELNCNVFVEIFDDVSETSSLVEYYDFDEVSLTLLSCYEFLMVKGYLFED